MKILARAAVVMCVCFYLSMMGLAVASVGPDAGAIAQAAAEPVAPAKDADEAVSVGVIDSITDKIPDWLELATAIVGLASMIAAVTPSAKDDGVIAVVRKVVDVLAFNFGSARNAKPTKSNRLN